MKTKSFIVVFLTIFAASFGQDKMSKADEYFYGYSYRAAIQEYKKEMATAPLRIGQLLNLADSYYKLGEYQNASKYYLDVNKKDSTMSVHRFNKLLQSLAKTSNRDRVKTFLDSKKMSFSGELLENAEFNYALLKTGEENRVLDVFNIDGNSPQADFSPSFYKDRLLFSSSRIQKGKSSYEPTGESYMDIYVARISTNGNIFNSNAFTAIPKTKYHEATPFYSANSNALFYVLSNSENGNLRFDENGKNTLAIGMTDSNGDFRFLLKDFSTSFYYPFFDATNERLYFAANLDDSYGGTDIYFVHTNNGQIMSQPVNLGPRINSPGNEIAPYIFDNSLYFSSDIFYGIGGMDVYKTNLYSDGSFSIPVNLGKGINSVSDDFGFILRKNNDNGILGYFSSNRKGGKGNDDIYTFKTNEVPGLKTFGLKGSVVNLLSQQGISKAQVSLLSADGSVLKEVYSDENGRFRVEIPWVGEVTVQASKDRHSIFSATYKANGYDDIQNTDFNMGLSFIDDLLTTKEEKQQVKLQKFYFDKGQSTITVKIKTELDKVVDAALRFPQLRLSVESHTNSKGSKTNNKQLSKQRAEAIKAYLVANGVAASNIATIGYGEDNLINNCADGVYCLDFLHNQNERTNIVIANMDDL